MPSSPSPSGQPSLRQIAAAAKCSAMTVSRALRDQPQVDPEIKARVRRVAEKLGYVRNPLAGAIMSELRRSRGKKTFRGVLAVLDLDGPSGRNAGGVRYHRELARGAVERAKELGFAADLIVAEQARVPVGRVDSILHARGVSGVFLLPVRSLPDLTRLGWGSLSAIYADYLIERPGLHSVFADHYRAMLTAMEHIRALGYRRPGLVLNTAHNARLLHRWEAAFASYMAHNDDLEKVPPLIMWPSNETLFTEWFRATKCDVVLSHNPDVLPWMRKLGARVPETHGFCALNVLNYEEPCAGLDLRPHNLGVRGMELLIGMVLRNERGVPEEPMSVALPVKWADGPTVRDVRAEEATGRAGRRRARA